MKTNDLFRAIYGVRDMPSTHVIPACRDANMPAHLTKAYVWVRSLQNRSFSSFLSDSPVLKTPKGPQRAWTLRLYSLKTPVFPKKKRRKKIVVLGNFYFPCHNFSFFHAEHLGMLSCFCIPQSMQTSFQSINPHLSNLFLVMRDLTSFAILETATRITGNPCIHIFYRCKIK